MGVTAATTLASVGFLSVPAVAASRSGPDPVKNDELKKALRSLEARRRRLLTGRPSTNGWEMEKQTDAGGSIWTCDVAGTPGPLTVAVRAGDVATVLTHVIRRFNYEIDALGTKSEAPALLGWIHPGKVRDSALPESNQASGTAVVIRPTWYTPGAQGGFTDAQKDTVRDILAECEGVVRWGGDDRRPYEGLFSIDVKPGDVRLAKIAGRIRGWNETPGEGAGTGPDPYQPARKRAADRLARQQA
ncbi:hypothetical protein AV521_23110 [Streptomyces sp. IMTB 2501]|nr:hypothetical protein AV521_23110 [Streptomyces sp. IMTB 2501]